MSKPYTKRNLKELADATKEFERGVRFEESKPLSARGKSNWERAKRGPGRPRVGQGAARVLITVERTLLRRADAKAREKKISRSQLIAEGLKAVLAVP